VSGRIDSRENGAVLALMEAQFLSIVGLVLLAGTLIGCGAELMLGFNGKPVLQQLLWVLLPSLCLLLGMTALWTGDQIKVVVNKHPKGLAGLYPPK
jgi:hypothetical protein